MQEDVDLRSAPLSRGLSTRILSLTVLCLLLGEILIFVPSIARFRLTYLQERIAQAHLATLVPASTTEAVDAALEAAMLEHAGAEAITVISDAPELMLGAMIEADSKFDLEKSGILQLIADAFDSLFFGHDRVIAVMGAPPKAPDTMIEVIMREAPMHEAMLDYGQRILILSLILSAIVGSLIFMALQGLIVRPLGRVTEQLAHFRSQPEDASRNPKASTRRDEIGIVERETARMQRDLRNSLAQKTRLAGLGEAVSKLNHDLRNILSTAILISDRLELSADPAVRSASPRLTIALERALKLCAATLDYAKSRPRPLQLEPTPVAELIANVINDLDLNSQKIEVINAVAPQARLMIDRDECHRVILNLTRNAAQAMPDGGRLVFNSHQGTNVDNFVVEITDSGTGLPPSMQERLFEPFAYSGGFSGDPKTHNGGHRTQDEGQPPQNEGAGLGLAISSEIMKRHGGDLRLQKTGPEGTKFALVFPSRAVAHPIDKKMEMVG